MKFPIVFGEDEKAFSVSFEEKNNSVDDLGFGEIQIVHDGQNGATFFPAVSEDGVISWTNDRELENPPPVNIKGENGYTPVKGVDYFDGEDGEDGYTPIKGVDYFDGEDGYTPIKGVDYFDGKDGVNGKDGRDGYTPIKGEDYFTDADKAEMVSAVIASLPVYNGEVVTA